MAATVCGSTDSFTQACRLGTAVAGGMPGGSSCWLLERPAPADESAAYAAVQRVLSRGVVDILLRAPARRRARRLRALDPKRDSQQGLAAGGITDA
jgi:hypothetical protein